MHCDRHCATWKFIAFRDALSDHNFRFDRTVRLYGGPLLIGLQADGIAIDLNLNGITHDQVAGWRITRNCHIREVLNLDHVAESFSIALQFDQFGGFEHGFVAGRTNGGRYHQPDQNETEVSIQGSTV